MTSDLCKRIKQVDFWDKILFSPFPRSHVIREGYRINITSQEEEEIKEAKEFLQRAHILFEDRIASSFSETVAPGDRTLKVTQQLSVNNLKKMWANEFEKSPLGQAMKRQQGRR